MYMFVSVKSGNSNILHNKYYKYTHMMHICMMNRHVHMCVNCSSNSNFVIHGTVV